MLRCLIHAADDAVDRGNSALTVWPVVARWVHGVSLTEKAGSSFLFYPSPLAKWLDDKPRSAQIHDRGFDLGLQDLSVCITGSYIALS